MSTESHNHHPQDLFFGKAALYLSLGFWVPLFNIGFAIMAFYFAYNAIKLGNAEPHVYGKGRVYGAIAMVIAITTIVVTVLGTALYVSQRFSCGSPISLDL